MKRILQRTAAVLTALGIILAFFPANIRAEENAIVTLTYNDIINTRTVFGPEIEQIKTGLDTESILWVKECCNYVGFITQNAETVNPDKVVPLVKQALQNGQKSIQVSLNNYVGNANNANTIPQETDAAVLPSGMVKISECTTKFRANQDRAKNIRVAASRINGVTLQPGQAFSYSTTILPRTVENGYGPGNVIVGDTYVKGIGGGICQVSSTLNTAVLRAGIIPIERHPHSHDVGYLPVGLDATVSENSLDYRFVNTLSYPLTLAASAQGGVLNISLFSDPRALGGITYEARSIGGSTYIIGKAGGVEVARVRAY